MSLGERVHGMWCFSALTLLVAWHEWHPACKKLGVVLLVVTIWLQLSFVTITSIILSSNKIQNREVLVPAYLLTWVLSWKRRFVLFSFTHICHDLSDQSKQAVSAVSALTLCLSGNWPIEDFTRGFIQITLISIVAVIRLKLGVADLYIFQEFR